MSPSFVIRAVISAPCGTRQVGPGIEPLYPSMRTVEPPIRLVTGVIRRSPGCRGDGWIPGGGGGGDGPLVVGGRGGGGGVDVIWISLSMLEPRVLRRTTSRWRGVLSAGCPPA